MSSVDRLPALVPVIVGQLVDVHADEAVGKLDVEAAPVLERVLHRLAPVARARRDRLVQDPESSISFVRPEITPRDVRAERQR